MVDKNLFLYDLAIVSIMKNEEPYVKEWIDYHLLAGVDHFYIYDNDSTPEFKKILQPYIDANIVTYTPYPGKCRQMESHFNAFQRFRFHCRYIAVIDGDEFIFPKNKSTIVESVDDILSKKPNASGLGVNIFNFGSNGEEKADYTRGVLERFTARPEKPWNAVSTIANPRRVKYFPTPHAPCYYETCHAVNENGGVVQGYSNDSPTAEKIAMYHYSIKSYEEFEKKVQRGNADHFHSNYAISKFNSNANCNDVYDNSILNYRDARRAELIPQGGGVTLFSLANKLIRRNFSTRL